MQTRTPTESPQYLFEQVVPKFLFMAPAREAQARVQIAMSAESTPITTRGGRVWAKTRYEVATALTMVKAAYKAEQLASGPQNGGDKNIQLWP